MWYLVRMTVFVAFIRAVNVGGTGRLPMSDLRRMCNELGLADLYMLGHFLISQVKNSGLYDGDVWVLKNLGGEFVSRADNDTNFLILAQQLLN